MATTNAYESRRPRDNRSNNSYSDNDRPGTSRETGINKSSGKDKKDFKPYYRDNKPYQKENKDNIKYTPYNKSSRPYNKSTNASTGYEYKDKKSYSSYNKDYKSNVYNKDMDDEDNLYSKKHVGNKGRTGESKSRTTPDKEKEQQPDKYETIKRLEKEKKAIQRKNQEMDKYKEKPNKPQIKHRRTNNIDWTKGYAKGLYSDDDEDYTEYI